jgi:hypothetical protein
LDLRTSTGPDQLSHIEELGELEPPGGLEEFSNQEISEISSLTPGQTGVLTAEIYTYGPNERLGIDRTSKARGLGGLTRELSQRGGRTVYYQVEISFEHQMKTRGRGRFYLPARETYIENEVHISTLLDREDSRELVLHQATSMGFEEPGMYFDEA